MEFRPCIDIHNGKVKQIIGSSLHDKGDIAHENFVSQKDAEYYAGIYHDHGLSGGHVIILNGSGSEYYEASKRQAEAALISYPGELEIGGGIDDKNAQSFIDLGASHVIVTSYVFSDGIISYEKLKRLRSAVGKEHIILDLSCRRREEDYYVVTDRWQKFTDTVITAGLFEKLEEYCDGYLVHAADAEGKSNGIETNVTELLGEYSGKEITYAGGIHSYDDIDMIGRLGKGRVNVTVGSALDLFGGNMNIDEIIKRTKRYS